MKLKKLTAMLLALLVLVLLPSCGSDDKDKDNGEKTEKLSAEEVYDKAEKTMAQLKSYTGHMVMDMNMELMGMKVDTSVDSQLYTDIENQRCYTISKTSDDETSAQSIIYFDTSVYMMEVEDTKLMADLTDEQFGTLLAQDDAALSMKLSDFEQYEMTEADSGYTFTVKGLKSADALTSLLGDTSDTVEGSEIDLTGVELTIQVNKDFHYTSVDLSFTMSMDMSELGADNISATVHTKINYSNFDSSADKIVKPSTDGYQKVDLSDLLG